MLSGIPKTDISTHSISDKKYKTIIAEDEDSDLTKNFKRLINLYMINLTKFSNNVHPELEVRFGTKKIKQISKIDFQNVIKSIQNFGFKLSNESYNLKIISDNEHANLRTTINGLPNIQHYCKYNDIKGITDENNIEFIEKEYFKKDDITIHPLDFDDFNFRIAFQVENSFNKSNPKVEEVLNKWNTTKKIFRYIKRFEFAHPAFPFLIHLSIVKASKSNLGKFVPQFNIKDSDVFNSLENYEIEIELNNVLVETDPRFTSGLLIYDLLKKTIKYILIGLQQTNFPVALNEQKIVLQNYLKLTKGDDYKEHYKSNPKDFVGPSSTTLQLINLLQDYDINDANKTVPNIRQNYTVTDKADGMRKLMYINNDGKIYLINTFMNVEFTGCKTRVKELVNTLIDGEHILNNKKGEYINVFAAFDIYFLNGKNVTGLSFVNVEEPVAKTNPTLSAQKSYKNIKGVSVNEETGKVVKTKKNDDDDESSSSDEELVSKVKADTNKDKSKTKTDTEKVVIHFRLNILNSAIKKLDPVSIIPNAKSHMSITIKKFYAHNIFNGCATILENVNKGLYAYNTDGLIFTPASTGVASKTTNVAAPSYKTTWNESFKWKPPEYNTIDFLVRFKKNDFGVNDIGNVYEDGVNLTTDKQMLNYYTLILHVGFDEKKHGYINPYNDLINDYVNMDKSRESYKNDYKPARFYPTNPSDSDAGLCKIIGNHDDSNNLKIFTEEDEEIEDNTIVEFKYDPNKPNMWKWVPLRIRYDKTSELRSGIKNFGNAYHVANANWQSIHYPVSDKIIASGEGIKIDNADDDVYYNKIHNQTETRSLRDFHNLYVKNLLISKVSNYGSTLIDYACGKGGDLPKWINANLQFILGIDLSKDNIENRMDGACARYLNYAHKFKMLPKALFINGNSGSNIKNGDAFYSEKNKLIMKAVLGEGSKNEVTLGKGVYKNYGIAKNGFNISSIQFALHYMFENEIILNEFLKNLSQCTMLNGYFVGCCYDGAKIFNLLNSKKIGESVSLFNNDNKIWELTKRYEKGNFNDDDSSLGYGIDIYQESINKTFREYLVNFDYLILLLEKYGFVLLNDKEYKQLGLPGSIGSFEEMFNFMNDEIKRDKRLLNKIGTASSMSEAEKKISFLNKYFVFKKVRNISNYDENEIAKLDEDDDKIAEEIKSDFSKIDKVMDTFEKKDIEDTSKKLAEKFLEEQAQEAQAQAQEAQMQAPDDIPVLTKTQKIKLDIEQKIKLADENKKAKELEKQQLKEATKAAKEAAKEATKTAAKTAKELAKTATKQLAKATATKQ